MFVSTLDFMFFLYFRETFNPVRNFESQVLSLTLQENRENTKKTENTGNTVEEKVTLDQGL